MNFHVSQPRKNLQFTLCEWAYRNRQGGCIWSAGCVCWAPFFSKAVKGTNSYTDCLGLFPTTPLASSALPCPGQRKLTLILLYSLSYLSIPVFIGKCLKRVSDTPYLCQTAFYKNGFNKAFGLWCCSRTMHPLNPCQQVVVMCLPLKLGRPLWIPQLTERSRSHVRDLRAGS